MVCEPAEQTAGDLVAALHVSKASISTSLRTLEAMGLVQRAGMPGKRRLHYRLRPDAWEHVAAIRIREMQVLVDIATAGAQALSDEPAGRRARVEHFRHWADWWLGRYRRMLTEWEKEHS
jgi:DNA-binding transcriptional regulator GbsR (MarR family)